MQFGAQVGCYRINCDDIRTVVETMDQRRWSSVWFAHHFLPPPGRPEEEHPLSLSIALHPGRIKRMVIIQLTRQHN